MLSTVRTKGFWSFICKKVEIWWTECESVPPYQLGIIFAIAQTSISSAHRTIISAAIINVQCVSWNMHNIMFWWEKGFFYLQLTFFQFMISVYPTTHPPKENTNKFQIRVKYICLYTFLSLSDHKMCTLQNSADVVQCLVVLGKQPWMTSVSRDQKTPKP